jgi:methylglutaconyl-CoA hydratase
MTAINAIHEGGLAVISLARAAKSNALDLAMIEDLTAAIQKAAAAKDVRAILLRGDGRHFCAGADIGWMMESGGKNAAQNEAEARALAKALLLLDGVSKPVVAAAKGAVIGGGAGLVCCADVCVAAASARFRFAEVTLGIIPAVIAPYIIRAVGARRTREWFLTAQTISAQEAKDGGLVSEIASNADLETRARSVAAAIADNPPGALAAAKRLVADVAGKPITEDLAKQTAATLAAIRAGDEARERLAAFIQKRAEAKDGGGDV